MHISVSDTLYITVVALVIVFAILFIIMIKMMVTARIFGEEDRTKGFSEQQVETVKKSEAQEEFVGIDLYKHNKNARVAVLVALIKASKEQQDKKFAIEQIEKVKPGG